MSNKLRILVCGILPPPNFGHSMMYQALMSSNFVKDHDVIFLDMKFWTYGQHKKVTWKKLGKMLWYYLRFVWLIISRRPRYILYNISFYPMPFLKDFLFCGTGIVLGRRVVFHDLGQYVRELHDSLPAWKRKALRWMLHHATGSIIMGERVRPAYEGLMSSSQLYAVPGTAADTRSLTINADRPQAQGLNVLYFSFMSESKGVYVAFEAASLVLKDRQDVCFTFAGPLENDKVSEALERLRVEYPGRVRYMGYVEDERERTALFRGADVFIFPTLRDVFGLVLLHALAEGVPVVASREGTVPEIVADGEIGFLVEKGNPVAFAQRVLELLGDEKLRLKMGAAGRQCFTQKYTLESYGQAMTRVFGRLEEGKELVLQQEKKTGAL